MSVEDFIDQFGGMTETYWFYNGEVQLRFDKRDHIYYRVDKVDENDQLVKVEGVSTVCHILDKSHALIPWAVKKMAAKIFQTVPITVTKSGVPAVIMKQDEFDQLIIAAKSAHKEILEDAGDVGHAAHDWIEQQIKRALEEGHNRVNELFVLDPLPEDQRAALCCMAALNWMELHNVRWIATEKKVYSLEHGYAGTMDGTALVDSCSDLRCCGLGDSNHSDICLTIPGRVERPLDSPEYNESSGEGSTDETSRREGDTSSAEQGSTGYKDRLALIDWKSSNYLYPEYRLQTAAYQRADTEEHGTPYQERWIIRLGKEDGEFEPWHLGPEEFEHDWYAYLCCLMLTRAIKTVSERQTAQQRVIKALDKERAARVKEIAHRIACPKSKVYKGSKLTKCFEDGTQCTACTTIYREKNDVKT